MRHCDYCNEVSELSTCISAHVITPSGQQILSTSSVWFVCSGCIEQYTQSRVVGVFTKVLRMKTGASAVEAQVFSMEGLGDPEEVERDIRDYHKAGFGKVLRKLSTQLVQSRPESADESMVEQWFRCDRLLPAFPKPACGL